MNQPLPQPVENYIMSVLPKMHGWCWPEKAEALAQAVLELKPELVVEIGVWGGQSLLAMAVACNSIGRGIVIGIDPWMPEASVDGCDVDDNSKWWGNQNHDIVHQSCIEFAKSEGVMDRLILVQSTSEKFRSVFCSEIDMLHIDGNHSEKHSVADVSAYVPLVRSGGIVVFDDTNWSSTKRAQQIISDLCSFIKFLDLEGRQCAWYRKK